MGKEQLVKLNSHDSDFHSIMYGFKESYYFHLCSENEESRENLIFNDVYNDLHKIAYLLKWRVNFMHTQPYSIKTILIDFFWKITLLISVL